MCVCNINLKKPYNRNGDSVKCIKIKKSRVRGEVNIDGSKNSALPIICASLLNEGITKLENVPNIKDINELLGIIDFLGCNINLKNNTLILKPHLENKDILHESCKDFRASYYLMGVYLALFNHVKIYLPGGCRIGKRPIDFHLAGFEKMGATYQIIDDYIDIKMDHPHSAKITLPKKSLGATVNLSLVAAKLDGITVIENISLEPEVLDFISFLTSLGINIIRKKDTLYIKGQKQILKNVCYSIIPDRIEASTYISLGLLTDGIKINNINPNHLKNILVPLINNGADIKVTNDTIIVGKSQINGFNIISSEYPALSTDIFPVLIPIMAHCKGLSTITETIYENRFMVCDELKKLGVDIEVTGNKCTIKGLIDTKNITACATDLRCAAALVLYAISAKKDIVIENIDVIERGYAHIYDKLKKLHVKFKVYEK